MRRRRSTRAVVSLKHLPYLFLHQRQSKVLIISCHINFARSRKRKESYNAAEKENSQYFTKSPEVRGGSESLNLQIWYQSLAHPIPARDRIE